MKKLINKTLVALTAASLSFGVLAASSNIKLESANTDINDKTSLVNGAKLFMNYCAGCHSIEFMRYNRIGQDLGLSDEQVNDLIFDDKKPGDPITSSISEEGAKKWFGNVPPDLSLVSRSKGVDWIYTYLKGFYEEKGRIFGVNNTVLANASMPDVLWEIKQSKSEDAYNQDVRDITNFLDYVGEPAKLVRTSLGYKVLGFLFVLFVLSYLLKKEYWKDVKYGKWRARD